jgi:hypothetical protein
MGILITIEFQLLQRMPGTLVLGNIFLYSHCKQIYQPNEKFDLKTRNLTLKIHIFS